MSIDGFIELLKDLGVSAASAEEVRRKIVAGHVSIKLSLGKTIDGADGPTVEVSGAGHAAQAGAEVKGTHTARVVRARQEVPAAEPDSPAPPANWEEAKRQVPGLRKWVEVKAEAGLTSRRKVGFDQEVYDLLVRHLRDHGTGLGKWVTSATGLPRNLLRHIDSGLRQELYALGNPELPLDIKLPLGKSTGRPQGALDAEKRVFAPRQSRVPVPSEEEARQAWRISQRARRAANREK